MFRRMRVVVLAFGLVLVVATLLPVGSWAETAPLTPIHHDLSVTVTPAQHRLDVIDRFTLPARPAGDAASQMDQALPPAAGFFLHGMLAIEAVTVAGRPVEILDPDPDVRGADGGDADGDDEPLFRFVRLLLPADLELPQSVEVTYGGFLHDPLAAPEREYARSFETTAGLIDSAGVFLSGATTWVPEVAGRAITFRLQVELPSAFRSMSQGRMEVLGGREVWTCAHPQEEIYLIAGRYHVTEERHGEVLMQTFTYAEDAELSSRYLEATASYLDMYTELLGPYPYGKFALVENFWQTGYGMPSFTLLGDQVIRMPWIISTSYGHEILHNWFGNGVYVVWERGNWCEGLTTYLADHLYKEQQGQGAVYRRGTLRGYRDFVRDANDFALTEFRSRHDPVTQAVGYGKTMMVFHMLRQELGDETFVAALQKLVADSIYDAADWDDVRQVFETTAGVDLGWFFAQWVDRVGAPELALGETGVAEVNGRYTLQLAVEQRSDTTYRLDVPISVALAGEEAPVVERLRLEGSTAIFARTYDARPTAVAVDPSFDLFRRLDRREIPPAFGELFGADRILFVIPSAAPPALRDAYRQLAETWAAGVDGAEVRSDAELALPAGDAGEGPVIDWLRQRAEQAIWVLGWENGLADPFLAALPAALAMATADSVSVGGRSFPAAGRSFVAALSHPGSPERSWGMVATDQPVAVPGLTRKLPHYRKYGYLVFQGEEPTNVHKGEWPALASPLVRMLDGDGIAVGVDTVDTVDPLAVAAAPPLVEKRLAFSAEKLRAHASVLADPALEGRGIGSAGLVRTADYIAERLRLAGLLPGGSDGFFQRWTATIGPEGGEEVELRNVIGILPGTTTEWQEECVIVGAHYDHLGRGWPDVHAGDEGQVHPGADDNASGVAIVLELARVMAASAPPRRNIVFAFFTGEEAGLVGSRHFAADPPYPLTRTMAMLNLDTVGRLEERQLVIFGANSTREMPHVIRGCGYVTGVPIDMGASDAGASDQLAFHEQGVPSIQLFSGPHLDYHRPGDTLDKLDAAGMARIAAFTREAIQYLAAREEPLTWLAPPPAAAASGHPGGQPGGQPGVPAAGHPGGTPPGGASPAGGARRASLGTVPDFTYQDGGMRLDGVVPGGAAEAAGLQAGDIITRLGGHEVGGLRDLSTALKESQPGDHVTVVYLRQDVRHEVEVVLQER